MTNVWISTFGTHFNDKITYDFYLQTMFFFNYNDLIIHLLGSSLCLIDQFLPLVRLKLNEIPFGCMVGWPETLSYDANACVFEPTSGKEKTRQQKETDKLCLSCVVPKIHSVPFGRMVGWSETLSYDANAAYSNQRPVSEDQAAKGDGWALSSICCAKDSLGL